VRTVACLVRVSRGGRRGSVGTGRPARDRRYRSRRRRQIVVVLRSVQMSLAGRLIGWWMMGSCTRVVMAAPLVCRVRGSDRVYLKHRSARWIGLLARWHLVGRIDDVRSDRSDSWRASSRAGELRARVYPLLLD
jgi:hypothetical protein